MIHPKHRPEATSLILSSGQTLGWGEPSAPWGPRVEELPSCQYVRWEHLEEGHLFKGLGNFWDLRGQRWVVQGKKLRPREAIRIALLVPGIVPQASQLFCDSRASTSSFLIAEGQQWTIRILAQSRVWIGEHCKVRR